MIELKPCPFCGSSNIEIVEWIPSSYSVQCLNCEARTSREYSKTLSIERWNTRHESDELPEWFVNKLNKSIIDCGLLEAELRDDNDIEEAVSVSRRANTLLWVLSLRRGEE